MRRIFISFTITPFSFPAAPSFTNCWKKFLRTVNVETARRQRWQNSPRENDIRRGALFACMAIMLGGCTTFPAPLLVEHPPASVAPAPFPVGARPVALVLSSGAARGFAHIGVIKALEEHGLKPDLVVGASAGSMIGALYASGLTAAELEKAIGEMDGAIFTDFVLPRFGILPGELGFVRGDKLHRFIDQRAKHHRIEEFPIRFAAVATQLFSGKPVAFNAGDVGLAVLASSAAPGLVSPVGLNGEYYADGQIASPLPIAIARGLGAKIVIAVDVVYPPEDAVMTNPLRVLFQAFTIATYRLKQQEAAGADLVIVPELGRTSGQWGFSERERLVAAGYEAARKRLPEIKAILSPGRQAP